MNMHDDETNRGAAHPGDDQAPSLYRREDENSRESQNEDENEQEGAGGVLTVVLTADNHLGCTAFGQQPHKREEREQRLRRAFQQATDFAIGQGVDLFIQAGDLFDTATPDERDRSFVAERLAQLKQANVRAFALGGVHDTPVESSSAGVAQPPPQQSYARLGALHYFAPGPIQSQILEPLFLTIRGMLVGICSLGVLAGQEGDPLAQVKVDSSIERAAIPLLILHAPIEGFITGSSLLDTRGQVNQSSIENQSAFRYILAGYHHRYHHRRIGQCEVIIAGATQYIDFSRPDSQPDHTRDGDELPDQPPGFVFLGIALDGLRWVKHIEVDSLRLRRLVISAGNLWGNPEKGEESALGPTERILEHIRPLCSPDTMVQLCLEGELTRLQYHQLNLNQIRRYGEEQCFALAIDDSGLSFLPDQDAVSLQTPGIRASGGLERFSPREELISLAEEWIAAAHDEQEKQALQATKEEILIALDEAKGRRV
jgi:DNA repair protein SbcD/Mre11